MGLPGLEKGGEGVGVRINGELRRREEGPYDAYVSTEKYEGRMEGKVIKRGNGNYVMASCTRLEGKARVVN